VLFKILVVAVPIQNNSFIEQFKPYIPALQEGVESHTRIYNSLDCRETPQLEKNLHIPNFLDSLCKSACMNVENIYKQKVKRPEGLGDAFPRFSHGLYVTLEHLIETNNLNRSAFKNLIEPMAFLIHTISRLTERDDWQYFSFGNNPLEFNAEGKKIKFQDPTKHADLIKKVKESSRMGRGCPMRNVNLEVDLDGTGKPKKVNIIKVLYYLCARQVEMALFGRKTETPA
jgi:hypothetical protein